MSTHDAQSNTRDVYRGLFPSPFAIAWRDGWPIYNHEGREFDGLDERALEAILHENDKDEFMRKLHVMAEAQRATRR